MNIPFLHPNITEEDIKLCVESIKSGWLAYGSYTSQCEEAMSRFFGSEDFVMTSSCTASLQMALLLAGVEPGDEVITTPLTWVATSNVITYVGATPVFCDVDPLTGLININNVRKLVTDKTSAVIAVDLYGQMIDYIELRNALPNQKIAIIEDAAHAVGSSFNGLLPGSVADFACFSFHAAKNLTSGQGGGLICRNPEHYKNARLLRRDGVVGANQHRKMISYGFKFDSTDFQSALLIGQIRRYCSTDESRKLVYSRYCGLFADTDYASHQRLSQDAIHSGHMFVLWLHEASTRDGLISYLADNEIQVSVHYNPVHLEPYYMAKYNYRSGSYPFAEDIGSRAVSLPTYPSLTFEAQAFIKSKIDSYYGCV